MALGFLDGAGDRHPDESLNSQTRTRVANLLAQDGRLAGSYAALGEDPWQFDLRKDSDGELAGFTAYLRAKRAAVVWRGPVGKPGTELEGLKSFEAALDPKVARFIIGADQALADAAVELGYQKIWVGTECVTSLQDWSLAGGHRRKIRWARNHAAPNHDWLEVFPATDLEARGQMLAVEAEWKATRKARATDSFLRTSLMDQADIRRHFACRELSTGKINSYVTAIPVNKDRWYLQDCVRFSTAERGTLEGAVALACETFSAEGFGSVSNGILPMYNPSRGNYTPPETPLRRVIIGYLDSRYRFSGLNQFRMKLVPDETLPVYALLKPGRPSPRAFAGFIRTLTKRL